MAPSLPSRHLPISLSPSPVSSAPSRDRSLTVERRSEFAIGAERCSIVGALAALGDTWSILVLREMFFGVHRFNDLQVDLGISRSVLTDRLARLVDLGVVRTVAYQEPGDRVRREYRLTRKGVGLLPVMVSLMAWGDEYVNDGDGPVSLHDRVSGDHVRVELRTESGKLAAPSDIEPRLTH